MKTIIYKFCDGTVREEIVNDELFAVIKGLETAEKNNEERETRRHISLNYLNDSGIDFEAPGCDPLNILIRQEEKIKNEKIFENLSCRQRELLESVYIDGKTME